MTLSKLLSLVSSLVVSLLEGFAIGRYLMPLPATAFCGLFFLSHLGLIAFGSESSEKLSDERPLDFEWLFFDFDADLCLRVTSGGGNVGIGGKSSPLRIMVSIRM